MMGMDSPETKRPLALIAGPTASGKTALSLALAAHEAATVINADSAQVYRDLPILSAQPSKEERGAVPHRLFGYLDGTQSCSAARWAADATAQIEAAWHAQRLPVLVGGTGLYLRTLLDGIAPIPPIDPDVREEVRAMPVGDAFAALEREDAGMAARLNPGDSSRIARALEIIRSTGRSAIAWRAEKHGGIGNEVALRPMILLPDRGWLYARCDRRFAAMMEGGAVAEVEALLARRLDPALPVMRAIGVPEIAAMLRGEIDREEAIARGQIATRRYAKRQYTWFRNQPPEHWPRWTGDPAEALQLLLRAP